jgi:hypothetical protein
MTILPVLNMSYGMCLLICEAILREKCKLKINFGLIF